MGRLASGSVRALVDTSALLALSRRRDQCHARAVDIAERHLVAGGQFVGTTLILGELHSHLLYLRDVEEARATVLNLLDDPVHEWVEVSADLTRDAVLRWVNRFPDQRFSLIDAASFEVMRRERLTSAFAFDRHFEVAGFELLA
jgi:predicted nucleic acid-binding protein